MTERSQYRNHLRLASASPRRSELLRQLGVSFDIAPANIDESVLSGEAPEVYVERVALEKGRVAWALDASATPVLAADTAVVVDGRILGKPVDEADAAGMLALLSGRVHTVLTSVAVLDADRAAASISRTEVRFRPVEPDEATAYWKTGEPVGKAGGYAIQGFGTLFVEEIRGSYSGVMGLPLFETARLLTGFGYRLLD